MIASSGRRRFVIPILFGITLLNTFDRAIAAVVNEQLRVEWGLADRDLGVLFGSFLVVYAFAALPMGRLADVASRRWILVAGVSVWSLLTAAAGFAPSFGALVALRCGVGIGEATFFPAAVSLLGDIYPTRVRGRVQSWVTLGVPLGVAAAFAFGGAVAHRFGWRTTFFLTVIPGLACALAALGLPEPKRGAVDGARATPMTWSSLLRIRSLGFVMLAAVLNSFATFSLATFLMPLLMRFHHVPMHEAGAKIAMITGLAPVAGMLVGGFVVDRWSARRRDAAMLVSAITIAAAAPLFFAALRTAPESALLAVVLLGLAHVALFPFWSLHQVIVQEVVPPAARGRAVAIVNFFGVALGGAFGPALTGAVSDRLRAGLMAEGMVEPLARAQAIQSALLVPIAALAVMAAVLGFGLKAMRRDAAAWRDFETTG